MHGHDDVYSRKKQEEMSATRIMTESYLWSIIPERCPMSLLLLLRS
jgi:hypothetical protein